MPVVDIHTHVFPPEVAPRAVGSLVERTGRPAYYDGTVDGLMQVMDRSDVDVSVLCPVATRPAQVESINTWTASVSSPRLVAFGSIHPAYADPERELERVASLGMKGIKLHPEFQEFEPTDRRMHRVYSACADLGLIVLFHAGEDPNYESVRGVPSAFREVLAEHPDLTVILAHLGGYRVWDEVAEHLLGERVYLDTAFTYELSREDFTAIVRGHGCDRVLFGSDGPWTDPAVEVETLRKLDLASDDLEAILWRNSAELLRLDLR